MVGQFIQRIYGFYVFFIYGFLRDGFLIKSHLTARERVVLYKLSSRTGVQICLEIGSYLGASAYFISAGLSQKRDHVSKVFCIDTWNNDAMSEGGWDTYATFSANTSPYSSFIVPVRGFSTDVVARVAEETQYLDLLFIDGDHTYEGVKSDWEAYRRFIKPGTIVVFHDWGWSEGVKRVVDEDVKQLVCEFGMLPNMWWGQIRV
jgi:predicted O-methyltransferase YrrM